MDCCPTKQINCSLSGKFLVKHDGYFCEAEVREDMVKLSPFGGKCSVVYMLRGYTSVFMKLQKKGSSSEVPFAVKDLFMWNVDKFSKYTKSELREMGISDSS